MLSRSSLGARLATPVFALSMLTASVFAQARTGAIAEPVASSASVDFGECQGGGAGAGGAGAGASAGASAGGASAGGSAGAGRGPRRCAGRRSAHTGARGGERVREGDRRAHRPVREPAPQVPALERVQELVLAGHLQVHRAAQE